MSLFNYHAIRDGMVLLLSYGTWNLTLCEVQKKKGTFMSLFNYHAIHDGMVLLLSYGT